MKRFLVGSSTRLRAVVVVIGGAIVLSGVIQVRNAPVDVYPEFEPTRVVIQTEAPGLSAAEVERLVAVPLEELLGPTPLLDEIRSDSVPGLSVIELVFQDGTDTLVARQLVQENLSSLFTLPNVTKPPVMLQPLSATSRVMMIGLTSEQLSLVQMSVLARWNIMPKLLGVPGVANVAIWGLRERQLQVQIDPELLRAHGVSLNQVVSTTGDALWVSTLSFLNASVPGTGGWIDTPTQRLGIRHVLPISSPEDLAEVAVDGTALRLGDIADIVEGHPPIIGDAFIDNDPALLLVVEKFPETSTLSVTRDIEEALDELRPGLSGIQIDTTLFRSATFIEGASANLTLAVVLGAVLIVLALALFLSDWRLALIGIVTVAVSLTAAVLVLLLLGATINVMTLTGLVIAVGAIIADAVISIEEISRRLYRHRKDDLGSLTVPELRALAKQQGLTGYSQIRKPELVELLQRGGTLTERSIVDASVEAHGPIVFGALIGGLAVMPIFFIEGVRGAFYEPLALSYVVAVAASMLVALIFTPALSLLLLPSAPLERRDATILQRWSRSYGAILSPLLRIHPAAMGAAGAVLLVLFLTAGATSFVGHVTVPAFEERDLRIDLESAPGTSPSEMVRIMARTSQDLQAIPGINSVAGQVGRAETGDQVVGTNSGQLWISIDAGADYEVTVAAIQTSLDSYPGLESSVEPYLSGLAAEALTPAASHDVVVRIYGPEINVLHAVGEDVRQAVANVDGLVGLRLVTQPLEPQVEIEVDLANAQVHGIKPGDVRRAAATYFAGIPVGSLFEQQKVFEVSVWSKPEVRGSLDNLDDVLVDKADGSRVRLADVAEVRIVAIPTLIQHDAASGYVDVVADVDERDLGSVVDDLESRLLEVDFPLEYNPQLRVIESEPFPQRTRQALAVAALLGIFLLLQLSFGSWRLAFLGFLSLPAALAGSVLAAVWFGDGMSSLGSLAGLLAAFGIAVRTCVLLIRHFQALERDEGVAFGAELVVRGTQERFAPIVMTAAIAALALLPMVVLGDVVGLEVANPTAVVFLGGLITSMLVYLFVVPAVYLPFAPRPTATPQASSQTPIALQSERGS
ncbi:MAG: efflux RND transporter permease subunit [Actinobacteria bacterium]|nr:efflux RND transporter permease subunit [Actinomycetota bacterium]